MQSARFGSTYTKIGTIQRRLAWPLRKDDTQIREAFHIFILMHIYGIQKDGNDNPSKRDTDVKNRLLDSMGEGEGGIIWENGIETCIISYMK